MLRLFLSAALVAHATSLKVACVGDSITRGARSSPETSYPTLLGEKLGDGFQVTGYGVGGRTAQYESGSSYAKTSSYEEAVESEADVYIAMLGTNDAKVSLWLEDEFVEDYQRLLKTLPGNVVVMAPPPYVAYEDDWGPVDENPINVNMRDLVADVARENGYEFVDLFTIFHDEIDDFDDYYSKNDGIHPNDKGNDLIATILADLLEDYEEEEEEEEEVPTYDPTRRPTHRPTEQPTYEPTKITDKPTRRPTERATEPPTYEPSRKPTARPTMQPTYRPTPQPTTRPTRRPTDRKTDNPTYEPTRRPTDRPSEPPTREPTPRPTNRQTFPHPTLTPTVRPTETPTRRELTEPPTRHPSWTPTLAPTVGASSSPSESPSTPLPTIVSTMQGGVNAPTSPSPTAVETTPSAIPSLGETYSPTIVPSSSEPMDIPFGFGRMVLDGASPEDFGMEESVAFEETVSSFVRGPTSVVDVLGAERRRLVDSLAQTVIAFSFQGDGSHLEAAVNDGTFDERLQEIGADTSLVEATASALELGDYTPAPAKSKKKKNGGLGSSALGIIIAVAAVLVFVLAILVRKCCCKRRRVEDRREEAVNAEYDDESKDFADVDQAEDGQLVDMEDDKKRNIPAAWSQTLCEAVEKTTSEGEREDGTLCEAVEKTTSEGEREDGTTSDRHVVEFQRVTDEQDAAADSSPSTTTAVSDAAPPPVPPENYVIDCT